MVTIVRCPVYEESDIQQCPFPAPVPPDARRDIVALHAGFQKIEHGLHSVPFSA
jgi:hypothetical protein